MRQLSLIVISNLGDDILNETGCLRNAFGIVRCYTDSIGIAININRGTCVVLDALDGISAFANDGQHSVLV